MVAAICNVSDNELYLLGRGHYSLPHMFYEVDDSDDCFAHVIYVVVGVHIECLNISKDVYDAINAMNRENDLNGVDGDCIKIQLFEIVSAYLLPVLSYIHCCSDC